MTAIAVTAGVSYYGIWSENRRLDEAEKSRVVQIEQSEKNNRVQTAIQMLSSRETVAADMRAEMFAALVQYYFERRDERSKLVIVELIALNFDDLFQLRLLFDHLDARLSTADDKRELRRIARSIAARQIDKIVGSGGEVCGRELEAQRPQLAGCAPLTLRLLQAAGDRIQVTSNDNPTVFEVTAFDMPFTDHSKRGELRYAVVLEHADRTRASVRIVVFPRHHFSAETRLGQDQLIGQFLLQDVGTVTTGK